MTEYVPVEVPRDDSALVEFLCGDEWAFHGRRRLSAAEVRHMEFSTTNVASFWIVEDAERVGLIRLLDLGDIGEGAPQFDLRIASAHRGRGLGTQASLWLAHHLFTTYPHLHRIEAHTRDDNTAMQAVLLHAGFVLEGRFRQSWSSEGGRWFDTMGYGLLRSEWRTVG